MFASLLVAAALQAVAQPSAAPDPPIVIHHADWEKFPDGRTFRAFYPKAARESRVEGRVTMHCSVLATGALTRCSTVDESPTGWGFGDAALGMASAFRMKRVTPSGQSVAGGTIAIPMVFQVQ
jgi:protein TonB